MDHESTITAPAVGKVPAEALPTLVAAKPQDAPLCGSVLVLIQFDVCEEIRLDQLRQILGARTVDASFKHVAPGYVRFQRPPVEEVLEPLVLESGERLEGDIKYFDYGVVSVIFELPFSGDWDKLVRLSSRWVWDTNFESLATRIVKQKLERAAPALVKPYTAEWLKEDYFIFHLREITGSPSATDLLASRGDFISQVVRGENQPLSDGERQEILQSRISYYPNDLAVIGWNAAFIYDDPVGAETAIQLLQYANSQLLEFRHYDELLTKELEDGAGCVQASHRAARRQRTDRARGQRHQVPQRHVLGAAVQAVRVQSRSARLQRPGQGKTADRRRSLPLHGRPVQPEPRLRPRADGGRHPDHRTGLLLPRQTHLTHFVID